LPVSPTYTGLAPEVKRGQKSLIILWIKT